MTASQARRAHAADDRVSAAMVERARPLLVAGATRREVADALGITPRTVPEN